MLLDQVSWWSGSWRAQHAACSSAMALFVTVPRPAKKKYIELDKVNRLWNWKKYFKNKTKMTAMYGHQRTISEYYKKRVFWLRVFWYKFFAIKKNPKTARPQKIPSRESSAGIIWRETFKCLSMRKCILVQLIRETWYQGWLHLPCTVISFVNWRTRLRFTW